MPNWTTPGDIRAEVETLWRQGRLLTALLSTQEASVSIDAPPADLAPSKAAISFPYRLRLRAPRASELGERFEEVRIWVQALEAAARPKAGYGFEIEWQEINSRAIGRNTLPVALSLASIEDALDLIDKKKVAEHFVEAAERIASRFPSLAPWIARKPHHVLTHVASWPQILDVVSWLAANPRANVYAREIDVAGIDTKFIENHKALLGDLLDTLLPASAIDETETGITRFEARFGLKSKPVTIRMRVLDPTHALSGLTDLTVPITEFARFDPQATEVFVVENEITFLSFPEATQALVIFGGGYAVERLASVPWLSSRSLTYWGDIDTHGFVILDKLRSHFPHTRSILMDRATLLSHHRQWSTEPAQHTGPLIHLNQDESALFDDLRYDRLGTGVRLEQELIRFGYARDCILGNN